MFFSLDEGSVNLEDTNLDYIAFGKGFRNLVIIQGLNVRDIKGAGISIAFLHQKFAKDYRVYLFDRRQNVKEGFSIWDIANDIYNAMVILGLETADFFGVSQGGMIAMALAIEHPEMIHKLVLGVTASRANETIKSVVGNWIECAKRKDHISINKETFSLMYTEKYLKKYKIFMPLLIRLVKPKDFHRFEILASSILHFDCYERLGEIQCPVLVIGGKLDKITTGEASEEIADKMKCKIYMYQEYGHAAYEEAKDFNDRVYEFLQHDSLDEFQFE